MLSSIAREVRLLPRVYWTLWWGTFINRAGGFVVPYLADYVTARGESEASAGLVVSLYGAGSLIAGFAGGVLADRVGRRLTMLVSMFAGAAAILWMGLAPSFAMLCTATFSMGLVAELYRPAVSAAVADVVPPEQRARAYAHLYWVVNLGYAAAPALAGVVASLSHVALFAIDAATLFAFALIVLAWVPETRSTALASAPEGPHGKRDGLLTVFSDRTFVAVCTLNLGLALVLWQSASALPLDIKRAGFTAIDYGLIMAVNGVMIVVLQPWLRGRLALLPRTLVLAVGCLLFGVGFGLYGTVHSFLGYCLATAAWTLAEIAVLPLGSAVVADLSPAALRGRYQGLYAVSWGLASTLGPFLGNAVLAQASGRVLWLGCGALMALVALGHLVVGPERARREREALGPSPSGA